MSVATPSLDVARINPKTKNEGTEKVSEENSYLSATGLLDNYRKKRLSPVDVTRAVLDRIAAYNPKINSFCLVDEEAALAAARASEARWMKGEPMGLVDGVPVSIKDLVVTKGWPTLFGSKTVDPNQPWLEDAPCVARLREHGAVLLGKTCVSEFGCKIVTDNPLTGITRNPWNIEKSPGGSSGGAAAAVAMGMGPLAIGTDAGGSIRIPSSWTGVFGLKPTFGRVPHYPRGWYCSLSHVGTITRTVEDASLMMTVITEPDPRDWHALPPDGRDYRVGLNDGVKGLKIAYSPDLGYAKVAPEVAQLVSKAIDIFSDLGAIIEQVAPVFKDPLHTHRQHFAVFTAKVVEGLTPEQRLLIDPGLLKFGEWGSKIGLMDFLSAMGEREALGLKMNLFHKEYDLLLTPTMPVTAPDIGVEWGELIGLNCFTFPFNYTKQPAASVPCGLTNTGLPVGLQIIGPLYKDDLVLKASRDYEVARGEFPLPQI
jgi:aspartyl-tRNA(Asn)/glutamyl-tRNA(Gln) amidotransferase subunit A